MLVRRIVEVGLGGCCLVLGLMFGSGQVGEGQRGKPSASVRFVVYGDTRDGHAMHRKLISLMMRQNPSFVLETGDLVHSGTKKKLWDIYDEITEPVRSKVPLFPVRGNHDVGGKEFGKHVEIALTKGGVRADNSLYYSFDRGGSHFIALAVEGVEAYAAGSKQYQWLISDLEAAKRNKVKGIFVLFHVPPYSIGAHGSDLKVRKVLCPVFQKYGVRAVFNGHDHCYYRTRRDGVTYIVSGGGGAPLYTTDPRKGAISGDKWESVNHILVCDLDDTQLRGTALRSDGSVLDTFTIPLPSPPTPKR